MRSGEESLVELFTRLFVGVFYNSQLERNGKVVECNFKDEK